MVPAQGAESKLRRFDIVDANPCMSYWAVYSPEDRAFIVVGKTDQAVGLGKFASGETVEEAWENFNRRLKT